MEQPSMQLAINYATRPLARSDDPPSSHRAAETIVRSGSRKSMKARVLEALRCLPGQTAIELAAIADLPHASVHKRLPDLRNAGLARSVKLGSDDMIWFATKEEG